MFWGPGHQRSNVGGCIYICYAEPPYSARIRAIYLFLINKVWLGWRRSRTQNSRKVRENSGPILIRLWTKVHKILGQCRRPFVIPTPFPDCLCYISLRRHSPSSLEVVETPNKCKKWPPFFREGWPQLFYRRLLARLTVHRLAKFGWVPFTNLRLPDNV